MTLDNVKIFLALGAQPQPGQTPPPMWTSLVPILLMVAIFYFILFRPQQKRAKEQATLLKSVKPGDKILTTSGIVATVLTVKEKTLNIRSADTKLEITKSAIAEITERGGETSVA